MANSISSRSELGTSDVLVVVNPASASGRTAKRWHALEERLQQLGLDTTTALTEREGHAIEIVREHVRAGTREIVVLGGDGTLNEVATGCLNESGDGVMAEGITIAIVHQGTGGDLARGLGIPKDPDAALAVAASGTPIPLDLGVATYCANNGTTTTRAFVVCSNVGMGADACLRATGRLKKLGNSGAFAVASLWCFLSNPKRRVTITLDGESHTCDITETTFANNRYMGGGMLVAPMAKTDDGQLDAVIISAASRLQLTRTFPKIYKGTHIDHPLVRWQRTTTAQVTTPEGEQPQGVVLDGEVVGTTPVTYKVLPRAINIRVP